MAEIINIKTRKPVATESRQIPNMRAGLKAALEEIAAHPVQTFLTFLTLIGVFILILSGAFSF